MTRLLTSFFAAMTFSLLVSAQQNDTEFQYTNTPVKGPIHMLSGAGGNIAVVQGADGLLVVDDGYERNGEQLESALATFGSTPRYVLNTHWHGDHTGANQFLSDHAAIIAHENVRVRLIKGATMFGRVIEPASEEKLPNITYQHDTTIHFAGLQVTALHLPTGHTDGDSVIIFDPINVVHMGDLMFADRFPFIDVGSGGSVSGYIENVATIIERIDQDTIVIPGHGKITDLEGLKKFHNMMVETTGTIANLKKSGKSLEQSQAAGLGDEWRSWGDGFISEERWISIVYNDL